MVNPTDYLPLFIIVCFCLAALATVLYVACRCLVPERRNPFRK